MDYNELINNVLKKQKEFEIIQRNNIEKFFSSYNKKFKAKQSRKKKRLDDIWVDDENLYIAPKLIENITSTGQNKNVNRNLLVDEIIKEDGKIIYNICLRKYWQDRIQLTSDDEVISCPIFNYSVWFCLNNGLNSFTRGLLKEFDCELEATEYYKKILDSLYKNSVEETINLVLKDLENNINKEKKSEV